MSKNESLGIVIVTHNSQKELAKLLASIENELKSSDYVVVIDNHPGYKSATLAETKKYVNKVLRTNNNGFAAACNEGVRISPSRIKTILFLNPDTQVAKGSLNAYRNSSNEYDAYMGLLLMQNGKVNSAGNVVHISGLSWCDGFEHRKEEFTHNKTVNVLSGACMAINRELFEQIGGMSEQYFLYYEDTDFSTRLLLLGKRIGLVPNAIVHHNYDYKKSKYKWYYIERNRWMYIMQCWPIAIILLLLPYLLLSELWLWLISMVERRFVLRVKSLGSFVKYIPATYKERRKVIKTRKISSYTFMKKLEPKINTLQLGSLKKFEIVNVLSTLYYKICLSILNPFGKRYDN